MKKVLVCFCAMIFIAIVAFIVFVAIWPHFFRDYNIEKWVNDPPIGIDYREPNQFVFPDNLKIILERSGSIIIKNPILDK